MLVSYFGILHLQSFLFRRFSSFFHSDITPADTILLCLGELQGMHFPAALPEQRVHKRGKEEGGEKTCFVATHTALQGAVSVAGGRETPALHWALGEIRWPESLDISLLSS